MISNLKGKCLFLGRKRLMLKLINMIRKLGQFNTFGKCGLMIHILKLKDRLQFGKNAWSSINFNSLKSKSLFGGFISTNLIMPLMNGLNSHQISIIK